ncbi:MAG TPA: rod shape-determining protein MreD [Streptosporangiaceae bacterium]|nr:rod shape-determining protein MreD [Streptosporangiaceae bacterium]
MRKIVLSVVAVAVALVVQLTYLNGLHLPGGGVADLVLVMTAALGLAGGPVPGAVTGFVAGLGLDLAPPGSGIVGIYALVLCIVGWTCGRFRGTVARSALVPMLIAAGAGAAGEILIAGLGMALQPAQVSWASVRQVLPSAIMYDVVISPFVLYLILLTRAWLAGARAPSAALAAPGGSALQSRQGLAGGGSRQGLAAAGGAAGGAVLPGLGGWLAGPAQSRRARRDAARRTPRLGPGAGRAGDGWIGSSAAARSLAGRPLSGHALASLVARPHGTGAARLRSGVAGSAAGGQLPRTLPARPVHLRLTGGSRREGKSAGGRTRLRGGARGLGALGRGALGDGRGARRALDRLGRRGGRGSFRPVVLTGGAVRRPAGGQPVPAAPRFKIHSGGALGGSTGRGTTGLSAAGGIGQPTLRSLRHGLGQPRRLRMNGRRGDGMLGRPLTGSRLGAGRAAFSPAGPGAGIGPAGRSGPSSRGWAARSRAPRGGLAPVRPGKGRPATPRFRSRPLVAGRPQSGKRPRFSHSRWAVLTLLARRRGAVPRSWRRNGRRSAAGR